MLTRYLMQSRKMRGAIGAIVTGSLVGLAIPSRAGVLDDLFFRPTIDDANYAECARDLARSGVAAQSAAIACANANRPEELGVCVDRIVRGQVAAEDALSVCRLVRRPVAAANCVIDISQKAPPTAFANVLGSCRQSLLPERFAKCVVDVSRVLNLPTEQSIANCLGAVDFAGDIPPTLLPGITTPAIVPQTSPLNAPIAPVSPTTPITPVSPGQTTPNQSPTPPTVAPSTAPGTVIPQRF